MDHHPTFLDDNLYNTTDATKELSVRLPPIDSEFKTVISYPQCHSPFASEASTPERVHSHSFHKEDAQTISQQSTSRLSSFVTLLPKRVYDFRSYELDYHFLPSIIQFHHPLFIDVDFIHGTPPTKSLSDVHCSDSTPQQKPANSNLLDAWERNNEDDINPLAYFENTPNDRQVHHHLEQNLISKNKNHQRESLTIPSVNAPLPNGRSTMPGRQAQFLGIIVPQESYCATTSKYESRVPMETRGIMELSGRDDETTIWPPYHSSSSMIEAMWDADQAPTEPNEIEASLDSDDYLYPMEDVSPNVIDEIEDVSKRHVDIRKAKSVLDASNIKEETVATPVMKYSSAPSSRIQLGQGDALNRVEIPMRRVSKDYPIPRWMLKKKVFVDGYRCPYRYSNTFVGRHGVVNYHIEGNTTEDIILCFHGLNATCLTFQEFQDVFAKYQYCVVTFDLYGHGLSSSPKYRNSFSPCFCRFGTSPSTYSLDFFIQQAEELLDYLGLSDRQLSLCGFSMGGVLAAGFASKHPDRVDRLVLISSAGMMSRRPPIPVKILKCCTCCIPCIPKFICRCCCSRRRFIKKFHKDEIENGIAEILWSRLMWQLFVKKGVVEAFLGSVANVPMWSAESIFKEVNKSNIPVLLLWGKQDAVAPVDSAPLVLDCFSNGHLIIFDRCSHLLIADQPHAAIATLLTFWEFPRHCEMKEWKYLLPFSPKGVYVPREDRCPQGFTSKRFLQYLNFCPRLVVKLPHSPEATTSKSSTSTKSEFSTIRLGVFEYPKRPS